MADRFYDFDEIIEQCDPLSYVKTVLGWKTANGTRDHFNSPFRAGSDSGGFQVGDTGYIDHVSGDTGSIIDLVAYVNHNGDIQEAQQELGDYLGLEPKHHVEEEQKKGRKDFLAEWGFTCVAEYNYQDENGITQHQVGRWEKEGADKEFEQHTPDRSNVKGVRTLLYRLPDWINKSWVCLCEGEKDADTLTEEGLPATTNPSGASTWEDRWSELLKGKHVALMEDNDSGGQKRCEYIALRLKNYVKDVKIVTFRDLPEKGDVTDYILQGHNKEDLIDKIKNTPSVDFSKLQVDPDEHVAKEKAKEANKFEFRNYIRKQEEGEDKPRTYPRHINDLIEEIHTRFLNFPRRQGGILFDQDKNTGRIVFFDRQSQLFSWIQRKSQKRVRWGRVEGCVTKEEMFEALRDEAPYYESIAYVPDWPKRDDVYYAHPRLPEPTTGSSYFWKLVDYFNYSTPEDRVLIASLFAAPIYHKRGIQRPMFVIDSESPGSGKTTLANMISQLYGHAPVEVKSRDLARDPQEITKRLVSTEGRQARVVLLDNITGTFRSEELSALVTQPDITGKPPYGRGEEVRPNNLVFILGANNANIDDDLSIRSWFVRLATPSKWTAGWKESVINYMENNRLQIFSDMMQVLNSHETFQAGPVTRFPEVETKILQAFCADEEEYEKVSRVIMDRRSEANVESEEGAQVEDTLRSFIATDAEIHPDKTSVFIRSELAKEWLSHALPDHRRGQLVQHARQLASQGHTMRIDSERKIWPNNQKAKRRRGLTWLNENGDAPEIAVDKHRNEIVCVDSTGHKRNPRQMDF